jgi:hypothetical protein
VRATVFIDGRVFDQFDAPPQAFVPFGQINQAWEHSSDNWFKPHNWAYLDPIRAELWGRVAIDAKLPWWIIRNMRAPADPWDGSIWIVARVPGSFCDPHQLLWPDYINYSSKLAEREFNLHMRIYREQPTSFKSYP